MSIYDQSIQAFVKVIESQSDLFSNQEWIELKQWVNYLPDETEEIVEKIEDWLQVESRRQILQAYEDQFEALNSSFAIALDKNLGMANSKSPTKLNQSSQPSRELLINSIKNNSPLSDYPPDKKP